METTVIRSESTTVVWVIPIVLHANLFKFDTPSRFLTQQNVVQICAPTQPGCISITNYFPWKRCLLTSQMQDQKMLDVTEEEELSLTQFQYVDLGIHAIFLSSTIKRLGKIDL